MATVSDIQNAHTTGLIHIDALVDEGPNWNYLLPTTDTLTYTFTVGAGDETGSNSIRGANLAFNDTQQAAARSILAYITSITGIKFAETGGGAAANIHFSNTDIVGDTTSGLCSWKNNYSFTTGEVLTSYSAIAYVYLDNVEWGAQNSVAAAGNQGYETLLHEMGHALGLKHPFEGTVRLPTVEDNTSNSVMSYTESGGPYSTFRPYDVATLDWIYGADGLLGNFGLNSIADGRFLIGSGNADNLTTAAGNDVLQGLAGNDVIDGGTGIDTALFGLARSSFTVSKSGNNVIVADGSGTLGTDTLANVERLKFTDKIIAFDVDGTAGKGYRLYQAAFDRVPDAGGLGFWVNAMDKGASLREVASGFVTSQEFTAMYGTNPTAESLVTTLYNHVLHRAAEAGGFNYWVDVVKNGGALSEVLAAFSESAENQAQLIGVIQNGMEFNIV